MKLTRETLAELRRKLAQLDEGVAYSDVSWDDTTAEAMPAILAALEAAERMAETAEVAETQMYHAHGLCEGCRGALDIELFANAVAAYRALVPGSGEEDS